jgi:hypothetical protein
MTGTEPTLQERQAAAALAEYLGGTETPRDVQGAPPGTHDFDIDLSDARRIALEVTTVADSKVVGFHNVLGDTDWLAPELTADWWVGLPDPEGGQPVISVKREKSTIVAALAALETHGISELNRDRLNPWARIPNSTPPAVREAIVKLISVPVTFVRSFGRKRDDVARLFFSAHGGAVTDPDQLNDLVVERVHAKRKKLAAANASERHLFVWLSGTYPAAELAFSTLSPPTPPAIPSEVDAVWLAKEGDPNRLWCLRPPRGWEIVRLDP